MCFTFSSQIPGLRNTWATCLLLTLMTLLRFLHQDVDLLHHCRDRRSRRVVRECFSARLCRCCGRAVHVYISVGTCGVSSRHRPPVSHATKFPSLMLTRGREAKTFPLVVTLLFPAAPVWTWPRTDATGRFIRWNKGWQSFSLEGNRWGEKLTICHKYWENHNNIVSWLKYCDNTVL